MRKNTFEMTCKGDLTHPEAINRAVLHIFVREFGCDPMLQPDPSFNAFSTLPICEIPRFHSCDTLVHGPKRTPDAMLAIPPVNLGMDDRRTAYAI